MNDKIYYIIYLLMIIIELSLSMLFWLSSHSEFKIKNKFRFIISSVIIFLTYIIFMFVLLLIPLNNIFYIMFILFSFVEIILFLFFGVYGLSYSLSKCLFCIENSLSMIFLVFQIIEIINKIINMANINFYLGYKVLILVIICLIFNIFMFVISLNKKNINNMEDYIDIKSMMISFVMSLSMVIIFFIMNNLLIKNDFYLIILLIGSVFYYSVRLLLDVVFLHRMCMEEQLITMQHIFEEEKKNFEIKKESMEMINIKYHDLKHWINNLKNGNTKDLNDIEYDIQQYEAVSTTKNEVLDVVFSNIATRCQMKNILFNSMVETDKLDFIDKMDLYSLFGNLLENAYEYESSLLDNNDRFITVSILNKLNFIIIHVENYVNSEIKIINNNVLTTKKDKENHGFGLKSIKKTVEKYKGKIDIYVLDDMFQVDIVFPEGDKHD